MHGILLQSLTPSLHPGLIRSWIREGVGTFAREMLHIPLASTDLELYENSLLHARCRETVTSRMTVHVAV